MNNKSVFFVILVLAAAFVVTTFDQQDSNSVTGQQISKPSPPPTPHTTPPPKPNKLIFVTRDTYASSLNGLVGADIVCTNAANRAGLPGKYVAWLSIIQTNASNSTINAKSRVTDANYIRVDGRNVAHGLKDLTDGRLNVAIKTDQFGNITNNTEVWTGTNRAGLATGKDCREWTIANTGAYTATLGNPQRANYAWTEEKLAICAGTKRLYCIQN